MVVMLQRGEFVDVEVNKMNILESYRVWVFPVVKHKIYLY